MHSGCRARWNQARSGINAMSDPIPAAAIQGSSACQARRPYAAAATTAEAESAATIPMAVTGVGSDHRVEWPASEAVPSGLTAQKRLKTSVPLVPPKPKLFFTATSIFMLRAVFAQ